MPKTPLRALRVPDELWQAAQARARECDETVSAVVRRALAAYVDPDQTAVASGLVAAAAPGPDSGFLLAQGMLMQRLGVDADAAAVYLRQLSQSSRTSEQETVRRVLDDGAPNSPEHAHG